MKMNGKGQILRFAIAVALSLAGATAVAKNASSNVIIGGDTEVIIGGDRQKSASTDVIIGGDRQKSASTDVIIGGDRQRTASTDVIIGGDRQRTASTDVIIGGDRQKSASNDVIIGGDNRALRNALAVGPVETVDRSSKTFRILGQSYKAVGSIDSFAALADSQQLVAVIGDEKSVGGLSPKAVLKLNETYVPGSTKVMLKGKVGSVNAAMGTLMIGRQVIDFTSVLSSTGVTPVAGEVIAVVGIQPVSGGLILASEIR
jgi:hypothetical protein